MGIEAAIIASTVIAASTSAYAMSEQQKARSRAQSEADEQKRRQDQLLENANAEKANSGLNSARDAARDRQRKQALGASGRRDTILTSPIGVVGGSNQTQKNLLGL